MPPITAHVCQKSKYGTNKIIAMRVKILTCTKVPKVEAYFNFSSLFG
jgi:hypothetical protein